MNCQQQKFSSRISKKRRDSAKLRLFSPTEQKKDFCKEPIVSAEEYIFSFIENLIQECQKIRFPSVIFYNSGTICAKYWKEKLKVYKSLFLYKVQELDYQCLRAYS